MSFASTGDGARTAGEAGLRERPGRVLESGDRMSRAEFHRLYERAPAGTKAELVEGVVYVSAAVRNRSHGAPHAEVLGCVMVYCAATPGVGYADNTTVLLDADNEVQPDVILRLAPERGGRCRETDDDYLEGPPELVLEVAASSASYDMHDKLKVYRRNGVREYLVWLVQEARFACFRLREDGVFETVDPEAQDGVFRSSAFPGLWIPTRALASGDLRRALEVVHEGLATPEHDGFVRRSAPDQG